MEKDTDSGDYNPAVFLKEADVELSEETKQLMEKANLVYKENFDGKTFFGRCLFISWYCALSDCTFCFRSVTKETIESPPEARRTMPSVLVEALFCREFNWEVEFITGGIGAFSFEDTLEIIKNVSKVVGKKVWVNLGLFTKDQMEQMKPYVCGICASMESVEPEMHHKLAPSKSLTMYSKMLENAKEMGFQTSIAVIVGTGEKRSDISYLYDFISKYELDRLVIFALKPVRGTIFKKGPSSDDMIWWLSNLRIKFPKLEIIMGSNLRRSEEIGYNLRAGANSFGKFPATKEFGSSRAKKIKELIEKEGRTFTSNLTDYEPRDWDAIIDGLDIETELKEGMKQKIKPYIRRFEKRSELKVLN